MLKAEAALDRLSQHENTSLVQRPAIDPRSRHLADVLARELVHSLETHDRPATGREDDLHH
jgi:hypothetical protein